MGVLGHAACGSDQTLCHALRFGILNVTMQDRPDPARSRARTRPTPDANEYAMSHVTNTQYFRYARLCLCVCVCVCVR